MAEEEEGKIPVLTVLKNNTVLKNIFIVNRPPSSSPSPSPSPSPAITSRDHEDVLLVGRHPDCDLMLTHPSISRFHLQIRSTPASQSLSLVDLSSVHGTWVSGRKVEPGVSVDMKEGDTLRIGVSSRLYRLHWIPISHAYDLENPFLSQLDAVPEEDQPEEPQEEEEEDSKQSLKNYCPVEMEGIQSTDSVLECVSPLFHDENLEATAENEVPAEPPVQKDIVSCSCEEGRKSLSKEQTLGFLSDPLGAETSDLTTISDGESKLCDYLNQPVSVKRQDVISFCYEEEMKSQSRDETFGVPSSDVENKLGKSINMVRSPPYVESVADCEITWTEYLSDCICLPSVEAVLGTKMQQFYTPPASITSPSSSGIQDSFAVPGTKMQQFYTPPDIITSPPPSGIQDSFEKHWSSLPIHTDPPCTSLDEKSAAEAIISTESEFEWTVKDNERVTDILTAEVGVFNHENMLSQVVHDTSCQQIQVVEEVAGHPLSDEEYLNIARENQNLLSDGKILGSYVDAMPKTLRNGNIWSRRGKACSAPQIRTCKSIFKSTPIVDTDVAMSWKKDIVNKTISKNLFSVVNGGEEEDEVFTPDKENFSPNTLQLQCMKNKDKLEEVEHSKSQVSHNSKDIFSSDVYPDEVLSPTPSKQSQKDLFSVLDVEKEDEVFTPDKENFSPNTLQLHLLKKKGQFSVNAYIDESMSLTSNKENQTPKVAQEHKLPRKPLGSLELAEQSQNSKIKLSANIYPEVGIRPTLNKENPTPKTAKVHKPRRKPFSSHIESAKGQDIMALNHREERVPFQLLMDAGDKSISGTSCPSAVKNIDDISWERQRRWDMVVDTATLMNKESMKALQLLKGLRGTRLIIPRLVIRELDRMKRQYSIFRRISEAYLALEWIEECMVKTNWWIHIQSSVEEKRLTAPTPPASPHTQFSEESCTFPVEIGSYLHSSHNCSAEIASPTAEDYILDFALLYRRRQNDGKLVLLSEDVTLKIKCMAEGLLCEPVQEFRESLVNPFSERFMWSNSSPRGRTWSCQDDVVLREKYCRLPMRKSSSGVASGLKLILLHNSQYGH